MYTQRFEKQMRVAQILDSDRLAAAHFKLSLPSELRHLVEAASFSLRDQDLSIKELINITLHFSWKLKDSLQSTRSGSGQDDPEKKQPAVTNKLLHCQLHGNGSHSTEQCRTLTRARNSRSRNVDNAPAASATPPAHAALSAPTSHVTCFNCKQPGHYASACPQKGTSGPDNPIIRLAAMMPVVVPLPHL